MALPDLGLITSDIIADSIPLKGPSADSDILQLNPAEVSKVSVTYATDVEGNAVRGFVKIEAETPNKGPVTFYIAEVPKKQFDCMG